MKTYTVVKEIAKALRKEFKGMQANSYGHCCRSDYDMYHKFVNDNDYVLPLVYKGGLNNNYDYRNQRFYIGNSVYYNWELTTFNLDDVIKVMRRVANQFNFEVIEPEDKTRSILIKAVREEE